MRQSAVLAVSAVVVMCATSCTTNTAIGGPLRPAPAHGYGPAIVEPGVAFSDGFEILTVDGDDTAIITDIRLINSSEELTLVDVLLAGPERESGAIIQFEPQFPPATDPAFGRLIAAVGAELRPNSTNPMGYELIFGLVVDEEGVFRRGGYVVDYTVAGQQFSRSYEAEIIICTPAFVGVDPVCSP